MPRCGWRDANSTPVSSADPSKWDTVTGAFSNLFDTNGNSFAWGLKMVSIVDSSLTIPQGAIALGTLENGAEFDNVRVTLP